MSYDDDAPREFRRVTPPGRRASMYAPKRSVALDLYDHREEQERAERDEMRRDILREERRQEELRESVKRQMDREAEDARRRERAMMYDERPGRWARGYGDDRFRY